MPLGVRALLLLLLSLSVCVWGDISSTFATWFGGPNVEIDDAEDDRVNELLERLETTYVEPMDRIRLSQRIMHLSPTPQEHQSLIIDMGNALGLAAALAEVLSISAHCLMFR